MRSDQSFKVQAKTTM